MNNAQMKLSCLFVFMLSLICFLALWADNLQAENEALQEQVDGDMGLAFYAAILSSEVERLEEQNAELRAELHQNPPDSLLVRLDESLDGNDNETVIQLLEEIRIMSEPSLLPYLIEYQMPRPPSFDDDYLGDEP